MARLHNTMSVTEALEVFGFNAGSKITKDILKRRYRKLAYKCHPDKNLGDKTAEGRFKILNNACEILTQNFDAIKTDEEGEFTQSVGTNFVDWIKSVDTKNLKNPFTVYQKGKSKGKK